MDDAKREVVQAWLIKANEDLRSARKLAAEPDPLLSTAMFHCQQAAEKALKALLVFHDRRVTKTHDVEVLLGIATTLEPKLSAWTASANQLTEYAAVFRYPGDVIEPEREQFE